MKSYTDLEQSKKLAEILPLESADMYYLAKPDDTNSNMVASNICIPRRSENDGQAFGEACAWSLAALFSVLPDDCGVDKEDGKYVASYLVSNECGTYTSDNPVDACVSMIEYLHELNLL